MGFLCVLEVIWGVSEPRDHVTFLSTVLAAQKVPQRTLDISSPSVKQIFKQAQKIPRKKSYFFVGLWHENYYKIKNQYT